MKPKSLFYPTVSPFDLGHWRQLSNDSKFHHFLQRHKSLLLSALSVLAVVAIWQMQTGKQADAALIPPPLEIIRTFRELTLEGYRQTPLWQHCLISMGRGLAAFIAAIILGVPLGIGIGMNGVLRALTYPYINFLRPLPKIALIPLVIICLGIGESAKFFLIFISTFLNVVAGAAAAVNQVPQGRIRVAQSMGASKWQIFQHVMLPSALPEVLTSIRLAVGVGWTSLIAAEMVAAHSGLGWMVMNAGSYLRTDVVIVGLLFLGGAGYFFDYLIESARKRWTPWAGKD